MADKAKTLWIRLAVFPWVGIILTALLLAVPLFTGKNLEAIAQVACWGLIGLVGAYLGMDLVATVKGSLRLAPDQSVPVESGKLIAMIIGIALLCLEVVILLLKTEVNYETASVALFGCLFAMMTLYVAGSKANKVAGLSGTVKVEANKEESSTETESKEG